MYYSTAYCLHRPLQSLVTKVQTLNHFWGYAAAEFDILLSSSLTVYQNCGDLVISANTIVSGSKTVPDPHVPGCSRFHLNVGL
jgi:hypothetical protein